MRIRIGTRRSRLSLAQTGWVSEQLGRKNPGCDFDIKTITTRGDTDARPLFAIDQKGIFEKDVDKAVAAGDVDFAVHSLKDVPSTIPTGLVLACIPKREQANDVLISPGGGDMDSLTPGAVVGTSSLRRAVQISIRHPDLQVRPIRGNIETRTDRALRDRSVDAVVLAEAGISRLGLEVPRQVLPIEHFVPSPGQGALALVCRQDDRKMRSILESIEDPDSRLGVEAERTLSDAVGSGCRFPVGAYGEVDAGGRHLTLRAVAFSVDGKTSISAKRTGPKGDAAQIGRSVGEEMRDGGVGRLAMNWREKVEEWNSRGDGGRQ